MMDTGQRVKLVKSRAWQIRRRQEKHITERLSLVSVALCCCLIYAMGHFPDRSPGAVQGLNGATMLLENVGSYVLVGVICFIAAVVLIGIGWWFIRSYIVLDGDLLGLATREKMAIQYAIESVNPLTMQTYQSMGYTVFEMFRERYTLSGLFHSFVGAFGSMSIYGSIWLYRAYKVFFAAGIVGALLYLIRYKKRRKISGREWFFHINMLYCIFMPVFLTIYYAYTTDYQNQGRYLLPALIPLMYYMTKGIQKLSEISFRGRTFPGWLVNAGIAVCFLIIIGGAIEMVYIRALPVYLETGLVLE